MFRDIAREVHQFCAQVLDDKRGTQIIQLEDRHVDCCSECPAKLALSM